MTIFQNTLTKFNEKNINAFGGKKKKGAMQVETE